VYQWFCLVDALDQVRVPSKSESQRFPHWLKQAQMRQMMERFLRAGMDPTGPLDLREPVDLEEYFVDTTALKANVHFPVDWVLLHDATRTLMKAVTLIRREGLEIRMEPPSEFLRRIRCRTRSAMRDLGEATALRGCGPIRLSWPTGHDKF
jgi:hypothetical protein